MRGGRGESRKRAARGAEDERGAGVLSVGRARAGRFAGYAARRRFRAGRDSREGRVARIHQALDAGFGGGRLRRRGGGGGA